MYLAKDQFSDSLRQGDILRGRVLIGPGLQVGAAQSLAEAASSERSEHKLYLQQTLKSETYVLLSQCCDIQDEPRVFVAPVVSDSRIPWTKLDDDQAAAFRGNLLGVESDTPNAVGGTPDDLQQEFIRLVLPGFFYLSPCTGVVEEASVVAFSLASPIRRKELTKLTKIAELERGARTLLRRRLAVYFGRIPEEDLSTAGGEAEP